MADSGLAGGHRQGACAVQVPACVPTLALSPGRSLCLVTVHPVLGANHCSHLLTWGWQLGQYRVACKVHVHSCGTCTLITTRCE